MRKNYITPAMDLERLGMAGEILQASGDFTRSDYEVWITDEWGN